MILDIPDISVSGEMGWSKTQFKVVLMVFMIAYHCDICLQKYVFGESSRIQLDI